MPEWKGIIPNSYKIFLHRIYRRFIFNLPYNYLPQFLIIGAQKAGTTTLFNYLTRHPKLQGALIKEINYFSRDTNYKLGISWYRKHFKNLLSPGIKKIYFEASPDYMVERDCLKRIHQFESGMKLIVILRDPVSRAFSAWNFFKKLKQFNDSLPSFQECIAHEMNVIRGSANEDDVSVLKFLRKGFYAEQLRDCFDIFGRDKVLVLLTDDLKKQPLVLLNRVLSFLGVEESQWYFLKDKNRNVGIYKSNLDPEIRTELKNFFDGKNRELETLLGIKLNW